MIFHLELLPSVGIEPPFIHEGGKDVANPNAGLEGPLDEIGFAGFKIDPSVTPVEPTGPPASRIVPGTRQVETNSEDIAELLLDGGGFTEAGLFPSEALFPSNELVPH